MSSITASMSYPYDIFLFTAQISKFIKSIIILKCLAHHLQDEYIFKKTVIKNEAK